MTLHHGCPPAGQRSRRRRLWLRALFVAWLLAGVLLLAALARAGPEGEPEVRVLLGGHVRPGRPLVVRVAGGADRVRADDSPWATPRGARADEFVVQTRRAGLGPLELTVERGGVSTRVQLQVRALAQQGFVVARLPTDGGVRPTPPADAHTVRLTADSSDWPTVPEAWLVFDALPVPMDGFGGPGRRALDLALAALPAKAGAVRWDQPLLLPPGLGAFRAAHEVHRRAPRLPADLAWAATLAGATSFLLLLLLRQRPTLQRLAWTASPVALWAIWVAVSTALPGTARATGFVLAGPESSLVVVRVEADAPSDVRFRLPSEASSATLFRFSPDDATAASVELGASVHLVLAAGEHRLLAYRMPRGTDGGLGSSDKRPLGPELSRWIADLGCERVGASGIGDDVLPSDWQGARVILAASEAVRPRITPGK